MVGDICDNCPEDYNPDQLDENENGIGDVCEGCCIGIRGNADGDATEFIGISDVVYLVVYLFQGGPEPPCYEEGDPNGDGNIFISDVTYLVAYLFGGGPAPLDCHL